MSETKKQHPAAQRRLYAFVALSAEERAALEKLARDEGRSMSGQLRQLLRARLQDKSGGV